jgi:methionyl-tRNA synthetase
VPANEFLNLEGSKISTSKNWAVWLPDFLKDFPNQQDVLRYVLTINAPENKDNDFTWNDFQLRNNSELVAILGNFINRVTVLTKKYYDYNIPAAENIQDSDYEILNEIKLNINQIENLIMNFKFREACFEFMKIARSGNKYLADQEPWKLIKSDPLRVKTIMFVALQISAIISIVSEPFMPNTSKKIKRILNYESHDILWDWDQLIELKFLIKSGIKINEPELLFSRIEDVQIEDQLAKLKS